jgi:phage terminase large subunit
VSTLVRVPRSFARALRKRTGQQRTYAEDAHPKQRGLVLDSGRRIAVLGGRRGGKSHGLARRLLRAGERHPGETSVYITLTRGKARQIIWDDCLARLNLEQGLGLRIVHTDSLLYIVQPNGSRIWLVGVDDKAQVEKIRGGKFSEVVIDEAMAMPEYLRSLVLDSAEPTLMDLRGTCVLAGTPCAQMAGYFYEVTTGANPEVEAWPTHQFTILDNPFLPHAADDLAEKLRKDYGNNPEHPTYRREWLGEWVEDIGALVYPFTWQGNSWTPEGEEPFGLPSGQYNFGLGVDLGYGENSTAFVFAAKRANTGEVYILRAYTESRWTAIKVAAHVKALRENVYTQTGQSLRVVVDEGGLGKGYSDQMRDMGVGCEAAVKAEKRAYQDYVQGLVMSGAVKSHFAQCRPLIDEARKLQFDAETGKEDERYLNHACDAFLYITRAFFPLYRPEKLPPAPFSAEAYELEVRKERQSKIDEREKRKRRD